MMFFLKHRLVLNALLSWPSDGSKYVWPVGLSEVLLSWQHCFSSKGNPSYKDAQ